VRPGLMCTIALGLKFCWEYRKASKGKLCSGGLLCVTGLDILPILYLGLCNGRGCRHGVVERIADHLLDWLLAVVPHNVAALIACFVAFLLLRHQADANRDGPRLP